MMEVFDWQMLKAIDEAWSGVGYSHPGRTPMSGDSHSYSTDHNIEAQNLNLYVKMDGSYVRLTHRLTKQLIAKIDIINEIARKHKGDHATPPNS